MTKSLPNRKRRHRRRKPVGIGDALRQRGFDEHTIAEHYVTVAERLKGKSDKSGGVEKLLVDVLKECSKYIEPPRTSDRNGDRPSHAPIHIHLVHNVARPERPVRELRAERLNGMSAQIVPAQTEPTAALESGTNAGGAEFEAGAGTRAENESQAELPSESNRA